MIDLQSQALTRSSHPAPVAVSDTLAAGVQFDSSEITALEKLAEVEEQHDACDSGHVRRVGRLASQLGLLAGLDMGSARALQYAAILHDIGKRTVSQAVLQKTGSLTPAERREIEGHAEAGAQLLEGDAPYCKLAVEIARHHHEWWNGCGYPCGLVGAQTPLSARIVAIVDVFDALVSVRPYKRGWKVDRALDYIADRAGTQFDPRLAWAFVSFMRSQSAYWREFEAATDSTVPALA